LLRSVGDQLKISNNKGISFCFTLDLGKLCGIAKTIVTVCISMIIDVGTLYMEDLLTCPDRQQTILILQAKHTHATARLNFHHIFFRVRLRFQF
jgi:hypothetical protein